MPASRRSACAAAALTAVLALTATACGPTDDHANDVPSPAASTGRDGNGGGLKLPDDLADRLKERGIDPDKWRDGEWRNWDREDWLREAGDFINPIIKDLWKTGRMKDAQDPQKTVPNDVSDDQGVTDPEPEAVPAQAVTSPYHRSAPAVGKVFFDSPKGSMVCSATVVQDPANPGKSNMVWTAGHCVHAGKSGGWYRNLIFVPSFNDSALAAGRLRNTPREKVAPYGVWWADGAATSRQWLAEGAATGGSGAPYDFAVLHVKPEKGGTGKSLEETVGTAMPVDFNAPQVKRLNPLRAWGYPAAPPYDGTKMFSCNDRAGRLSVAASKPTMYRIGCTMTGGSSGGGWFTTGGDGRPALVSNTSIGPVGGGWLAGPHLGSEAKDIYEGVSRKFAGR